MARGGKPLGNVSRGGIQVTRPRGVLREHAWQRICNWRGVPGARRSMGDGRSGAAKLREACRGTNPIISDAQAIGQIRYSVPVSALDLLESGRTELRSVKCFRRAPEPTASHVPG